MIKKHNYCVNQEFGEIVELCITIHLQFILIMYALVLEHSVLNLSFTRASAGVLQHVFAAGAAGQAHTAEL